MLSIVDEDVSRAHITVDDVGLVGLIERSSRKHNNSGAIFVLNLFLGWSCLGWIIAIVWAHTDNTRE